MPPIQDQDSRPLLLQGPSLGLRLAILAAVSIALMVADQRQQYTQSVRAALSAAAYPFVWLVDAPFTGYAAAREALRTRETLEAENSRLEAENLKLSLKLLRFEALEQENQRLRAARESSARVAERFVVAEILSVDLDPFRRRVLVDKGSMDGAFRGQAALDARGVFGQVTRVGPVTAEVIMISDPEHSIPVQINRTGVRTIAVGTGQPGRLALPYLPRNADIEVGDLVVTSGLGGVFPPGYPVASISEVRRDPAEPLLMVDAVPLADLDRDPEVLLVWFDNRIVEPPDEEAPPPLPQAPAPASVTAPPAPAAARAASEGPQPAAEVAAAPESAAESPAAGATAAQQAGANGPAAPVPAAAGED